MANAQCSGIGNYFCASHEPNDPYRFNMPKTYKKKRPKVFYRETVVPSESPAVPTPAPVMTVSRKKLALSSEASTSSPPSMLNYRRRRSLRPERLRLPPRNESFNSLIWSRFPKTEFCSLVVVETAVNMANNCKSLFYVRWQ